MKRAMDLFVSGVLGLLLFLPMLLISIAVKVTSKGPVLYWSDRVGRNNALFRMPKFRTMRINTPEVATHLLDDPDCWLTPIGNLLRRTSLDELPQLWSVLTGAMTIVGPRPALFNQDDLVALRTVAGVHELPVGVTGWAQVNGRDESSIPDKVSFDAYYLKHRSILFDLKIIVITAWKVIRREGTRVPPRIAGKIESIDQRKAA